MPEKWVPYTSPLNKALSIIKEEMHDGGLIKPEFQNIEDLSALTNILLYGGNGNEKDEIKNLGDILIDEKCDCRQNNEEIK